MEKFNLTVDENKPTLGSCLGISRERWETLSPQLEEIDNRTEGVAENLAEAVLLCESLNEVALVCFTIGKVQGIQSNPFAALMGE